jgi:hypothetical protein
MPASREATAPVLERAWTERPLWQVGLAAALVASAANVVLYMAARTAGVPMELTEVFDDGVERMPVLNMVWGTLLEGGVAAISLAAGCQRWATRPRAYFVALAVIGTTASFGLPLASDGSAATIIVLSISHVVAALIIVPALALTLPPRSTGHP